MEKKIPYGRETRIGSIWGDRQDRKDLLMRSSSKWWDGWIEDGRLIWIEIST
jgi:hypothetical protein